MKHFFISILLAGFALVIALLAGCGSTGSSVNTAQTGKVTVSFTWPEKGKGTRPIPVAAQSLSVTLTQTAGGSTSRTQSVDRGGGGTATLSFDNVLVGTFTASATAWDSTGGSGNALATASQTGVVVVAGATVPVTLTLLHLGPPRVNLASAANFAVLAGSTVTNTGASLVNGNLGVSPGTGTGTSVTGFGGSPGTVNGSIFVSTDATVSAAKLDLTNAYNDAAGRSANVVTVPGGTLLGTLVPGLYKSGIASFGITSNLTLDAKGDPTAVWIFQMSSTLTVGNSCSVTLIDSTLQLDTTQLNALAGNIYWQVGSSATLGTYSVVAGNILAYESITLTTGASLTGRALAETTAVTLDTNTITKP